MRITWDTEVNAPCCPGQIVADDGRAILIQTDWDYPGTAQSFGWSLRDVQRKPEYCCGDDEPCEDSECRECAIGRGVALLPKCDHCGTDGTVDCKECGVTAAEFISAARDWLDSNDGATADDPGYFSE